MALRAHRTRVSLVEVDFTGLSRNPFSLERLLGRQAHVEFAENKQLAHFLVWGVLFSNRII